MPIRKKRKNKTKKIKQKKLKKRDYRKKAKTNQTDKNNFEREKVVCAGEDRGCNNHNHQVVVIKTIFYPAARVARTMLPRPRRCYDEHPPPPPRAPPSESFECPRSERSEPGILPLGSRNRRDQRKNDKKKNPLSNPKRRSVWEKWIALLAYMA